MISNNETNLMQYANYYDVETSNALHEELKKLNYYVPSFKICGKSISPHRKIYGMGDEGVYFEFSGLTVHGEPWSPAVLKMKTDLEAITKASYNFALLNYFFDGSSKISAHREEDTQNPLATFAFGDTRQMQFRRKGFEDVNVHLAHGALLLTYHPTNALYTQAVLEDPNVKGPSITVTFRHILPGEMPRKKLKLDWLDHLVQRENKMETTYVKISHTCYVVVKEFQRSFYVDLRHHDLVKGEPVPTKKGVMLSSQDWCEFSQKLYEFDFLYPNRNCMTSNLMLLNLNEQLHIQPITVSDDHLVFLKFNFLKLYPFELDQLLEKMDDINNIVLECLWTLYLPKAYSKKHDESLLIPCDQDTMRSAFRIILEAHFAPIIRKHYRCQGCLVSDNSQLDHDCLNIAFRDQYLSMPYILMCVDIDRLIDELCEKHIFTNDFFSEINVKDIDAFMFVKSDVEL